MTTSISGAFRYAGIAALPLCLALAFVAGETARKDPPAIGQGPQTETECIAGVAHMVCPDEAATANGDVPFLGELTVTAAATANSDVPFLGELTVTAPRGELAASTDMSASDRAAPIRTQVKRSPAKYLSVL